MSPPIHLVILAGGTGSRARREADASPKQFTTTAGRPLLAWSVARLGAHPDVVSLTLACPEDYAEAALEILRRDAPRIPSILAAPGVTRTASTLSALEALASEIGPAPTDLVAVHDAARPLADSKLLSRLAAAAHGHGGAVPGVPVTDTTVRATADGRLAYLPRAELRGVQTPQVFVWEPFWTAHRRAGAAGESYTDDGGLMAAAGSAPVLVEGAPDNVKVTTAADLDTVADLLKGLS